MSRSTPLPPARARLLSMLAMATIVSFGLRAAAYRSRSNFRAVLDFERAAAQTLSAAKGGRLPALAAGGGVEASGEVPID